MTCSYQRVPENNSLPVVAVPNSTPDLIEITLPCGMSIGIDPSKLKWEAKPGGAGSKVTDVVLRSQEMCYGEGQVAGYTIRLLGERSTFNLAQQVRPNQIKGRMAGINVDNWLKDMQRVNNKPIPFTDTELEKVSKTNVNLNVKKRDKTSQKRCYVKYWHGTKDGKSMVAGYTAIIRENCLESRAENKKVLEPIVNVPLHVGDSDARHADKSYQRITSELVIDVTDPKAEVDAECRGHYKIEAFADQNQMWHRIVELNKEGCAKFPHII